MKKGFTLAEVLITLGIIGVVAAITIPSLIQNNQKRVIEAKLKEDYSILQQVMKYAEYNDLSLEGSFPDNDAGVRSWYETYLKNNIKVNQVCFDKAGCWHSKNPTRDLAGQDVAFNRTGVGVGINILNLRLNNGSNINIDGYGQSSIWLYFGVKITIESTVVAFIDANGDSGPNIVGKDIQIIVFTNKGLLPAGYDKSIEEINKNCSKKATEANAGYFCMSKIKNSGWEIPNDVWKIKV